MTVIQNGRVQAMYPASSAVRTLQVIVVATYGPEDRLVGGSRKFDVPYTNQALQLKPKTAQTVQKRSWRARRRLEAFLHEGELP